MNEVQTVKGTRDFYPEDLAFQRWLIEKIRYVSELFGYQEFDGPFLERLELYAAKSGEELVQQQSFVFPDRSGEMIALRPELTPTLARMVAARSKAMQMPLRWWSYGPFWRYENPQKGRSREFFQWNIDLLGIDSPQADAEIVSIGAKFFEEIGLSPDEVKIFINNRPLVEAELEAMGIQADTRGPVFRLIDRKDKTSEAEWQEEAEEIGLGSDQMRSLKRMLGDKELWKKSAELVEFFKAAEAMGMGEYTTYEPTIIRGLDYYTGTVYEARDTSWEYRSILGGGRYDELVAAFGGEPIPATGFAMGDMVIQLVLEEYGKLPGLQINPAQVLVPTFDTDSREAALRIVSTLRRAGIRTEWYPLPDRLSKQFRYADKNGIPLVVVVGPEEIRQAAITIKEMSSGEQITIEEPQAVEKILELLDHP